MNKPEDIAEILERIADEYSDDAALSTALKHVALKARQYIPCTCNEINKPKGIVPFEERK